MSGRPAPAASLAAPAPGERLDRYELLELVAQGGMANVWLARLSGKHGVAKLFAVKTILPQFADDPQIHAMFVDEARIASRVEHPNVAQLFELGEHGGVLYIVMEWVDGDSLDVLVSALQAAKTSIPIGVATRIAADACAGLHAAHELKGRRGEALGVVHRDVSPQNLLVTPRGMTKVIDFGIAKAKDRLSPQTTAGSARGKICYMAREQALGQAMDRRADIWALGAVLHFLLAGNHPFEGSTPLDTLRRVMNGERPRALPPAVPSPIAAIVTRALAHDANDRFETAAAMRAALLGAAEELALDTSEEAVAELIDAPLADRRAARAAMIERATGERTDAAAAPTVVEPPKVRSETIAETPRATSARRPWAMVGIVAVVASVVVLSRRPTPTSAPQPVTAATPSVEPSSAPSEVSATHEEGRDAAAAAAATASAHASPPVVEHAPRQPPPHASPAVVSVKPMSPSPPPSSSEQRDYGF